MKFLIFGDVVGRPGREAVHTALPLLRAEYQPDAVIINVENIAHGAGISPDTMKEALQWEADVYTTGDHAWDNKLGIPHLDDPTIPIVRPANYPDGLPGRGYYVFTKGAFRVAVINLQGQVFFKNHPLNPFHTLDKLLQKPDIAEANVVLVDFQAEATSEKRGLGWHADGRISALWGTHTHVPTADAQILPQGTGYISDVGMCGSYESVIGVDPEGPLQMFLTQIKVPRAYERSGGPYEIGAVVIEVDPSTRKTTHIELARRVLA